MIFANPPLLELVAELRWLPGASGQDNPSGGAVTIQFPIPFIEETFETFRRSIAEKGFVASERLVPAGFPTLPFTIAQRFRKPSGQENYAYQIGLGVFSANALPPYRSWESFRPIVREGVSTLLSSRHASDRADISVLLRYLDMFTEEFTGERKSLDFLNDVLGITLRLPAALAEQTAGLHDVRAALQFLVPLRDGLTMNLAFQEATAAGKSGVLMTTEVSTVRPVAADLDSIMENFEKAHGYIRGTFLGLTTKIHDKMKLVEGK